jgi:hypothetical protein
MGKVAGLWALSVVFMLVLHAVVFLIAVVSTKVVMPGYIVASLLCSFNLLFVIVAVLLLSLLMPETAAFLCILGIAVVGLVIDGVNALGASPIVRTMAGLSQTDLTSGRILYYIWPKLSGMQGFASSFISNEGFQGLRSAYPLFNILAYCLMLVVLLLRRFGREEIT